MMRRILLLLLVAASFTSAALGQSCPQGASWCSGTYGYDGAGNIRSIGSDVYIYDTAGRLVSGTAGGIQNQQIYSYDALGNRTGASRIAGSIDCLGGCELSPPIDTNTNHISGAQYDDAGNLTVIQSVAGGTTYTATYTFDTAGRLARAVAGTDVRDFIYTADDERIATANGASWTWTIRGLDGKVLREFTSMVQNGLPTANRFWAKDYVWRDGLLLASVTPTNAGTVTPTLTQHFHLDHLGTPRLVTGDSGVQLGLHTYYPFGAELNLGTNEQPYELLKFTGHERDVLGNDPHTLDDMHARYYSGTMGRFLSVDPVFDMKQAVARPQMWNRYSYVTNNPVLKTDPDGRVENVQQPGFTKPLSEAGGWADQPSVSWAFNSEAFLLTLAADEFVIGPAIGKAAGAIGRFVGRFFGKAEEAVETGAKLSRYDDVTTGRSVANRATNVSRGDFAKNLESNGFTKTVSKDAKVTIFQKDGVKYTLRDTAKSTGGPTAEVFKDGKLVAKIRLEIQ
jgi:RHS repeat-associated protein